MRITKLLQRVVLIGGLEQASGELVPFRMDLETVEVYKERSWTFIYITVMLIFFVVIAVLLLLTTCTRSLEIYVDSLHTLEQSFENNKVFRKTRYTCITCTSLR